MRWLGLALAVPYAFAHSVAPLLVGAPAQRNLLARRVYPALLLLAVLAALAVFQVPRLCNLVAAFVLSKVPLRFTVLAPRARRPPLYRYRQASTVLAVRAVFRRHWNGMQFCRKRSRGAALTTVLADAMVLSTVLTVCSAQGTVALHCPRPECAALHCTGTDAPTVLAVCGVFRRYWNGMLFCRKPSGGTVTVCTDVESLSTRLY